MSEDLLTLPTELVLPILLNCDPRSICRFEQTCRRIRAFSLEHEERVWEQKGRELNKSLFLPMRWVGEECRDIVRVHHAWEHAWVESDGRCEILGVNDPKQRERSFLPSFTWMTTTMRPTSDFGIARADQHLVRLLPHGVLSQTRHGAHPTFAQYARKTFPSDYLHGLPPNDPLYQVLVPSARSCYTGMISSSEITFFRSDTLKTCITIDHQYSGYMLGGSGPSFLFGFTFALMLDQSNFKVWFLMDSFGDDHRHNPEELLHCQDAILPHSTLTCNDGYVAYLSIEGLDSETPYTVVALLSIFGDRHTYECDQIPETRQLLTRSHLLICIPHSDWKIQVVSLTTYDCIRTITIAALTDPIPPERPVKLGSYWVGEHMGGVLGRLLAISDIRLSDCGGRLMISKRQIDVINRINCTQKLLNGLSEIPLMEQAAVLESSSLTVVDVMSEKGIRYNHVMGANLKDSSDVLWYGGNVKNRGNWFWYTPTGKFEDLKCSWVKL